MQATRLNPCRVFACLLPVLVAVKPSAANEPTALDRYVAAPDPAYVYRRVDTFHKDGCRLVVLEMTSQKWLTEKEVDRPVWKHWVTIIEPAEVKTTTGLLLISGGSNEKSPPKSADSLLIQAAMATGSVVAELRMVPNQPLTFSDQSEGRVEDGIIAYTWDKFLRTGDEKWPARLPMTKSAVRAMDTVTSFCKSKEGGGAVVDRFVVAGASKRGWTTWTTAAVDKRVVAIVPIVIDTLNVPATSAHQFAAYGFFSEALKDYEEMKLAQWAGTPQYAALMRIEDPYSYRERFTMAKLILNATGDQYFLPDNSQFYFADLPGPKYLRYVPNADHSLNHSDAAETFVAFYAAIIGKHPLPRLGWTFEKDGSIRAKSEDRPSEVKLWQATNPEARDFRLETLGPKWTGSAFSTREDGTYVAAVQKPAKGWTAFFVEFTFKSANGPPLKLTTQVRVVPDVLPHAGEKPK